MGFSTSGNVRAWRFDDLAPDIVAKGRGWRDKEIAAQMAKLRTQHADPAWIDATLARLPIPAIALLAALVDEGQPTDDRVVLTKAERAFGVPEPELAQAAGLLIGEVLLVVLSGVSRGQALSLVEPSAGLLAERLRDLTAPTVPEGAPFVPSDRLDDSRALLAACGALRHADVKLTQTGLPHRAAIKRLAKSIGMGEDMVEQLVVDGIELGVLAPTEDEAILRPDVSRLRDLALGTPPSWRPVTARLVDSLRRIGGPVARDRIGRWRTDVASITNRAALPADRLGSLPGLCVGRCGDVQAISTVPLGGSAAATITPSFEVFVPPESRHEHIVAILACAELVRIDRAIVARITKLSIQRAAGAGDTATTILASLSNACRTPVPQNVAAAIEDWAVGQHAVTAVGRVIVVTAADHARVLALLQPFAPRALAPGVLVVSDDVSQRSISTALARIGITTRAVETKDRDHADDESGDLPASVLDRLPPLAVDNVALRRRFADYRAGKPAERTKLATNTPMLVSPAAPPAPEEGVMCSDRAIALVEQWEDERNSTLPNEVATVAATLLDAIPIVDQEFLLAAKNPRQMIQRVTKVLNERGGLEAFLAKNRDLVNRMVGPEIAAAAIAGSKLDWLTKDLAARLTAAASAGATYLLDLGDGRVPIVHLHRLIDRGSVTMVLGEDVTDKSTIAVPLHSIRRIAALATGSGPTTAATTSPPPPWRALPGETLPAGHLPCPCGSGARYRACCRPKN